MFAPLISVVFSSLLAVPPPISPVRGEVIAFFRPPACERCAGHRGVTVATAEMSEVRAVRAGMITFVGQVAGPLYVVQEIQPGVRVTYGWLADTADMKEGRVVIAGDIVGRTQSRTYLGVRVGETYVDPLRYLGFARTRLVGPNVAIGGRRAPIR